MAATLTTSTLTTATNGGFLKVGDVLIEETGARWTVEAWDLQDTAYGRMVAVWFAECPSERYLFGLGQPVTIAGYYPERAA
jgi:hypothetical protein